ncbi:hypothetical protein [Bosea sp. BK604]|uniref:hypothetical protein n=1 Tax=Bosea sp. BK604 TaxID=2512180 RepID=UPI001046E4A4|nr:hypothetical protein [Bosea sp. BK604]TCR64241.1 hypothetical protein EV560_107330 [Bosea sp. BK604]
MTMADLAFYLFSFFNGLRVFSYLPQIVRVMRDTQGAVAISYSTWGLWTAANASTSLYAAVSLHDVALAQINALNALFCTIVIGVTAFKRHQLRLACARATPTKLRPLTDVAR